MADDKNCDCNIFTWWDMHASFTVMAGKKGTHTMLVQMDCIMLDRIVVLNLCRHLNFYLPFCHCMVYHCCHHHVCTLIIWSAHGEIFYAVWKIESISSKIGDTNCMYMCMLFNMITMITSELPCKIICWYSYYRYTGMVIRIRICFLYYDFIPSLIIMKI